jgi:uncharacterized repeat protein (TIGR03803 family)
MRILNRGIRPCALFFLCVTSALHLPAQTFTTLHNFGYADGAYPNSTLVQDTDGNFYGVTGNGGTNPANAGTVFKITPSGTLTTFYTFCSLHDCFDGAAPSAALLQSTDGNLYGTTYYGGARQEGTVFKITPTGKLTTLHSFCTQGDCTDGDQPDVGLARATTGSFYGTTEYGGANMDGEVYRITSSGVLKVIHSFNSLDGEFPWGVIQATDGNFYGTTQNGGAFFRYGTVFKITPSGALTTLHSFDGTDGAYLTAGLVQASDGNFYGTTSSGGANQYYGTVFKITPSGTLTVLHSFDGADGNYPSSVLLQATDGNFYGTTIYGGTFNDGTIFKITPDGTLTVLHSFNGADGEYPYGGLMQATDGSFYGTTSNGGAYENYGTVFSLSVGLAPFVETNPGAGKVGAKIFILGSDLTGATSVTFNGAPAVFTLVSKTFIRATVPSGATTGIVQVTAPGGTLSSNVVFRVLP